MKKAYEKSIENDIDLYNLGGKLFIPLPVLNMIDTGKFHLGLLRDTIIGYFFQFILNLKYQR